jgi:DNA-binding XRE family transcriptional regulator
MNIATILKSEISRVARIEARAENAELKKTLVQYRTDMTELKRCVSDLEKRMTRMSTTTEKATALEKSAKPVKSVKALKVAKPARAVKVTAADDSTDEDPSSKVRFSAKGLATQRKRLGLSAANMGKILGVSGGAIYLWEDGKTRPRINQLPAIANLRKMGKKEVAAKLLAPADGAEPETE